MALEFFTRIIKATCSLHHLVFPVPILQLFLRRFLSVEIRRKEPNAMSDGAQENLIRLVLVDELGLFRASLACFLSSEPGFQVTGQCGTSAEALDLLKNSKPDVVLLDFEIGTEHANDFISAAMQGGYQRHFLIVAGAPDIQKSAVVLRAGASGIFLKSESPERLLKAIKAVVDGGVWVDPKVIRLLAHQVLDRNPPFDHVGYETPDNLLEDRERSVLLGILGGLPNRAIASNLGISESLVKNVIQRLFARSGVRTRSQLVRIALEGSLGSAQEFVKSQPSEQALAGRVRSHEALQSTAPTVSQSRG